MSKSTRPIPVSTAISRLKAEIALNREFTGLNETAFLSLLWTWQRLEKLGRQFFLAYGISDVQFNVLMILWDYRERALRQHELADILVVNRASVGSVLERMERDGLIRRATDPTDRRAMQIILSKKGIAKLNETRGPYYQLLSQVFPGNDENALRVQILYFDAVRSRLDDIERNVAKRQKG